MQTSKIKLFFFIDSFHIGGMHRQVLYLVKHINKEIFEPIMCTQTPLGGLREEFEQVGCKLFDLKWKRKYDLATIFRLITILKVEKPDIIFITEAQNLFYYRIARLFTRQKPLQIGSFRALTFWKGHLKRHYQYIDNIFAKWLYSSSATVVVNSISMKTHYSSVIKSSQKNQLKVIYNGCDFNFNISKSPSEIRRELNMPANEILIIMVARLDPWKDFVTLFEAAKIVVKNDAIARFLIVGDGMLRSVLEHMVLNMGLKENLLLMGEKKDVFNYLNAADISILSTNGEGFSNTILESMALCKPVIATNVGGNPELLGVSGESGILVPPKSPVLLADAILGLMKDEALRKKLGQSAKDRIHQLCSITNYISSYEDLFLRSTEGKNV